MQLLRISAGLTASQVAQQIGVSESTVRNWDKGRSVPTLAPDQFLKLARIYQCSVEDIATATANSRKGKILEGGEND